MSSIEPKVMLVSLDGEHNLLEQEIHGENRIVKDPWAMTGKERVRMILEAPRDRKDILYPPKILAVYTTTNMDKIACLQTLLADIIHFQFPGLEFEYEDKFVKTPNAEEKVGKQPISPDGQLGNLYRIEEAFYKTKEKVEEPHSKYDLKNYHAVFILSIESDIEEHSVVPYERPNMMIYECFSGQFLAGVGCGPGVQKDLLAIAKDLRVEYGRVLAEKFGVDAGNWHHRVSEYCRSCHFDTLRKEIVSYAEEKIRSGELNFYLPNKLDVRLG